MTSTTSAAPKAAQSPLTFAQKGYTKVEATRAAIDTARKLATAKEEEYLKGLRRRLSGKTVEVTGFTEAEEYTGQNGTEYNPSVSRLNGQRVLVESILMTAEGYERKNTPLVYGRIFILKDGEYVRGYGIDFRLLELEECSIILKPDEPPKDTA